MTLEPSHCFPKIYPVFREENTMHPWNFGWSAIAAIGQVLGALFTAAAVWLVLRPYIKRITLNLTYDAYKVGKKEEVLLVSNESFHTITLVKFGVYLNRHRIDSGKLDIELKEIPLTVYANSCVKITKCIVKGPEIREERIYTLLGFCLLGKENPYQLNRDNPKVYFYVEDTCGKEYKTFIGKRKDIITRYGITI